MKFTIQQSELKSALDIASKAVNARGIVPIMGCYLFQIGKSSTISATNGEIFITKNIRATSDAEISVAIYAERLNGLIRSLPEQPLHFEVGDNEVHIKCESGAYSLPFEDGKDFPRFDSPKGTVTAFSVDAKQFNFLLKSTLFASTNEISSKVNGLCIDLEPDFLTLTGCSGAVLSTRSTNVNIQDAKRAVINQSSARLLSAIEEAGTVEISLYEKNIQFNYGGAIISIVLIDNIYPDFRNIIPTDYVQSIEIDRMQLLWSVKRVVQFSNKVVNLITVSIDSDKLTLTGEDVDLKEKATEAVATKFSSAPVDILINGNFLIESLSNLNTATVKLHFKDERRPLILRDSESSEEKRDLMLLMPFIL